jgi:hypothetical protein
MSKPDEFFIPFAQDAARACWDAVEASLEKVPVAWLSDSPKKREYPGWDDHLLFQKAGWVAAVRAVFKRLEVRDSETGELYVE